MNQFASPLQPQHNQHHHHSNQSGSASTSASASPGPAVKSEEQKEKKVSCTSCREAKVKCLTDEGDKCRRCIRYDSECVFEGHKRGRRKGKIKQHQVDRRFELIARTLEELRTLTRALNDSAAVALVSSVRYQLLASTSITEAARSALLADTEAKLNGNGKKRQREQEQEDDDDGSESEGEAAQKSLQRHPMSSTRDNFNSSTSSYVDPTRRPPPAMYNRSNSNWELSRNGMNPPRSPAYYMLERTKGAGTHAGSSGASESARRLVELEDQAAVDIVPQAVQTLSNPLKLLAHASDAIDSASRRSSSYSMPVSLGGYGQGYHSKHLESNARGPIVNRNVAHVAQRGHEGRPAAQFISPQKTSLHATPNESALDDEVAEDETEWATYFSRGAFHPRYDTGPGIDPIDRGLVTLEQAEALLAFFYDAFGTFIHCFDPVLATLQYLRKHSAFLVTVICCIASEFHPDASQYGHIYKRLTEYIEELLPAVLSGVFKSIEAAQGCFILASYQRMSRSAIDDQTLPLLHTSIRIACELGINLACFSYSVPADDPTLERHHRQLRNTERLWLSLWVSEKTLASQTGQKLHLAEDPVVSSCGSWHQRPYSMVQDTALVAFVDLRRIMERHASTFHTQILRALTGGSFTGGAAGPHSKKRESGHSEQLMLIVDLFRANAHIDFKRWEESWLASSAPGTERSPLQSTGILHLHFAMLVTLSLPLRSASERPTEDFSALRRDCYGAALGFLSAFVDRCERGLLPCINNAIAVSAVYCSIFALKLCGLSAEIAPFIDTMRVLKLAKNLAKELSRAGSYPAHRAKVSVPARFAEYLNGFLSRWEAQRSPGLSSTTSPNLAMRRGSGGGQASAGGLGGLLAFTPLPSSAMPVDGSSTAFTNGPSATTAKQYQSSQPFEADMSTATSMGNISLPSATALDSSNNSPWATIPTSSSYDVPGQAASVAPFPSSMTDDDRHLDNFWQTMTGSSWDNLTGFAPLLDQMAGFEMPSMMMNNPTTANGAMGNGSQGAGSSGQSGREQADML